MSDSRTFFSNVRLAVVAYIVGSLVLPSVRHESHTRESIQRQGSRHGQSAQCVLLILLVRSTRNDSAQVLGLLC